MTRIIVFPGQGAQVRGMGKDLFDRFPDMERTADAVLGTSIRTLCVDDPDKVLARTRFTQPALFTVCAMAYRQRLEDTGIEPDFVAGHSLGEYAALWAASAFDFETGLKLVVKRGALMDEAEGGGMAAVVGIDADAVRAVLASSGIDTVDVANFNGPTQTVLAGPTADLDRLGPQFTAPARFVPINVRTAFHSRWVRGIKDAFAAYVADFTFKPLLLPVMSNFTALPYRDDEIAHNIVQQIDHSVRWVEITQYLLQEEQPVFEEIGPGQVLTRLIEDIRRHPIPVNIRRVY